jgi:septum formation protein
LILGSASPRRRDLLRAAGLQFEVEASDVDEDLAGRPEPEQAAVDLALRKALAVAHRYRGQACWVLGADTVVALGSGAGLALLGKPADAGEAVRMLSSLSGTRHQVVTGVALVDCARWSPGESLPEGLASAFERTWVVMRAIEAAEIEAYVNSGEWRGKAGGYAIQESADAFVTGLEEGGFDNVVGLPVGLCLELLRASGALAP